MSELSKEKSRLLISYEELGSLLNRLVFSEEEKERYWKTQKGMKERIEEIKEQMTKILEEGKKRKKEIKR